MIASGWKVVQAWQKSVDASGGLNRHLVVLTEMDNVSNPGTAGRRQEPGPALLRRERAVPGECAADQGGRPVAGCAGRLQRSIAAAAPNYTAQCVAAKQAGVTAVFIGDSTSVIARVAQDCDKQG